MGDEVLEVNGIQLEGKLGLSNHRADPRIPHPGEILAKLHKSQCFKLLTLFL